MKKILIICSFLTVFLIPIKVNAVDTIDYSIAKFTIDAYVNDDGSLYVQERIIQKGSFNGYIRDINYKNDSLPIFNGKLESFKGSDIYNASAINFVAVSDFDVNSNQIIKQFDISNYANNGDYGVYQYTPSNNGISLKMYNPSNYESKGYYITYNLDNVIVVHNDVAELYWNFIGDQFKDTLNNVTINIHLPKADKTKKVWAHGPLDGLVENDTDMTVKATMGRVSAYTPVDIRMTFDKTMITSAKKITNVDALDKILTVEKERADEANRQRAIAKTISTIMGIFIYTWIAGLIYLFIYIYNKYDKERKSTFNNQYNREIIEDYSVGVVDYVMKKQITSNALSACILDMIRKKIIKVEQTDKKNDYILIYDSKNKLPLLEYEEHLITWLIQTVGDGQKVSLRDIKDYGKGNNTNAIAFMEEYKKWQKMIETEANKFNFYEDSLGIKLKAGLYAIIGIVLFVLNIVFTVNNPIGYITLFLAIIFLIYIILFSKRTTIGNEHYAKWKAFKRFLLDFGRFKEKELPEIVLWEKYLVYATILGVADKVEKVMKIKLQEINPNNTNMMYMPLYYHMGVSSTFSHAVSTTMTSAIASSTTSSATGSGGGFSSGGGFGGGGGGGGGF